MPHIILINIDNLWCSIHFSGGYEMDTHEDASKQEEISIVLFSLV